MKNKLIMLFALLPLLVAAQCNPAPIPPAPPGPVADAGPSPAPTPSPTPDPPPVPTVVVDAGPPAPPPAPATPVELACANLRALACSAGMSGCESALQHIVDAKLTTINLGCLTAAKSKVAARVCKPAVACP